MSVVVVVVVVDVFSFYFSGKCLEKFRNAWEGDSMKSNIDTTKNIIHRPEDIHGIFMVLELNKLFGIHKKWMDFFVVEYIQVGGNFICFGSFSQSDCNELQCVNCLYLFLCVGLCAWLMNASYFFCFIPKSVYSNFFFECLQLEACLNDFFYWSVSLSIFLRFQVFVLVLCFWMEWCELTMSLLNWSI